MSGTRKLLRVLALGLLVLATCFRFRNLDSKVYWHDEVGTSAAITARPGSYLTNRLFQNRRVTPADLLACQRFVPDLTLRDMIVRKGTEDSQHPPLYYVLLRFWAQTAGTSPAALRGFTAFLSLLVFPALYWLCLELFESSLAGWIAMMLFAVSPFHLVYAQEARENGVWTAMILASGALLLRATGSPSARNWLWYGLSMAVAFYTSLFTLWIAVGHLFFTLTVDPENRFLRRSFRLGRCTVLCVASLVGVTLVYIPWIRFIVAANRLLSTTTSWTSLSLPLGTSLQATSLNFTRSFFDVDSDLGDVLAHAVAVPLLLLQGYAVYRLCRTAPERIRSFVLTLAATTALALGLPDLIFGGQRFTVTRYLTPCLVGLQLSVVHLLSTELSEQPRGRRFPYAAAALCILVVLGIASCVVYSSRDTWWNKVINSNYHRLAALINSHDRPLVVATSHAHNPGSTVSLGYLLKRDVELLLLPISAKSLPPDSLSGSPRTVFLFNVPEVISRRFPARHDRPLAPVFQDSWNEVWMSPKPRADPDLKGTASEIR